MMPLAPTLFRVRERGDIDGGPAGSLATPLAFPADKRNGWHRSTSPERAIGRALAGAWAAGAGVYGP